MPNQSCNYKMTFLLIHRKCCFIYFTVGILWEKKINCSEKTTTFPSFNSLSVIALLWCSIRLAVGEVLSVGQAVKYMKMHLKVQNVSPPLQFPEDVQ